MAIDPKLRMKVEAELRLGKKPKELSEKYVPQCIAGEKLFAFALSEPDYGSDASGIKTRAVKKDGGYLINGTKASVSYTDCFP